MPTTNFTSFSVQARIAEEKAKGVFTFKDLRFVFFFIYSEANLGQILWLFLWTQHTELGEASELGLCLPHSVLVYRVTAYTLPQTVYPVEKREQVFCPPRSNSLHFGNKNTDYSKTMTPTGL